MKPKFAVQPFSSFHMVFVCRRDLILVQVNGWKLLLVWTVAVLTSTASICVANPVARWADGCREEWLKQREVIFLNYVTHPNL